MVLRLASNSVDGISDVKRGQQFDTIVHPSIASRAAPIEVMGSYVVIARGRVIGSRLVGDLTAFLGYPLTVDHRPAQAQIRTETISLTLL